MKNPDPIKPRRTKCRKWFGRQRRSHDPLLALNMSIFNSGKGVMRLFSSIPERENIWA